MGDRSNIEWTDATWNPVRGCAMVSAGCTNCYAMKQAHRQSGENGAYHGLTRLSEHGPIWTGEVRTVPDLLEQPLHWKKPRRIFVNSMSDLFHEAVPDDFIDQVFHVMGGCEWIQRGHVFQVLTKRPARMLKYMLERGHRTWNGKRLGGEVYPPPNVQLGVSVEDQVTADERIPLLLETPAAVRFISAEPLLGSIDLSCVPWPKRDDDDISDGIHALRYEGGHINWVIVGGESGPKARPMHPDWARSLRDQCVAAGVAFFFKQWGEWAPSRPKNYYKITSRKYSHDIFTWGGDGHPYKSDDPDNYQGSISVYRVGKKTAGATLDGREWRQYPEAR